MDHATKKSVVMWERKSSPPRPPSILQIDDRFLAAYLMAHGHEQAADPMVETTGGKVVWGFSETAEVKHRVKEYHAGGQVSGLALKSNLERVWEQIRQLTRKER